MDELQEIFNEYRIAFVQKLADKFNQIDELEKNLADSPGDIELIRLLYQVVHSISGNSGIVGLTELSNSSLEFEAYLNDLIKSNIVDINLEKVTMYITELTRIYSEIKEVK